MRAANTASKESIFPNISAINLFVNRTCNLDCQYCYVEKTNQILRTQTAKAVVEFCLPLNRGEAGRVSFGFLGGEPTLSLPVIDFVHQQLGARAGGPVSFGLTTNGTCLDPAHVAFLQSRNVRVVLSLDGSRDSMAYRRHRDLHRDPYDAVVAGLRALQGARLRYLVQMTITPANVGNLASNVAHIANLGVSNILFGIDLCSEWTTSNVMDFRHQFATVLEYYAEALAARKKLSLKFIDNEVVSLLALSRRESEPQPACNAAVHILAIDTEGAILPCQNLVNFSSARLGDVWSGIDPRRLKEFTDASVAATAKCMRCGLRGFCRLCPAANMASRGDVREPVAAACELGKAVYDLVRINLPRLLALPSFRRRLGKLTPFLDVLASEGFSAAPTTKTQLDECAEFQLCGLTGPEESQSYLVTIGEHSVLFDAGQVPEHCSTPKLCILTHGHMRNTRKAAVVRDRFQSISAGSNPTNPGPNGRATFISEEHDIAAFGCVPRGLAFM